MFAAHEVEARFFLVDVPELAAFCLANWVIGEDDVAALGEVDVQGLIGRCRLADCRVPAWTDDARKLAIDFLGLVKERGHEVTGSIFEDELVYGVIAAVDRSGDRGFRRSFGFGQAVEESQEFFAQRFLQRVKFGLGLHAGKLIAAFRFQLSCGVEKLLMQILRAGCVR
jgi:hypothetical protein